jgi:ATP-binding cassette subfamily B protein
MARLVAAGLAIAWRAGRRELIIMAVLLEEGRVVESGTHDELVAAAGTYAELFTLQASPYQ